MRARYIGALLWAALIMATLNVIHMAVVREASWPDLIVNPLTAVGACVMLLARPYERPR